MIRAAVIYNTVITNAAVSIYMSSREHVIKVIFYHAPDLLRGCMPNAWPEQIPTPFLKLLLLPFLNKNAKRQEREEGKAMKTGNCEK